MAEGLSNILFTDKSCRACERGVWEKTACDEATYHTIEILGELHKYYVCLVNCGVAGFKTEVYKISILH